MNFKTICLLAFSFSATLLAMDTTPEYVRLQEALRTEGTVLKDAFVEACGLGYVDLVTGALNHPDAQDSREAGLIEACSHGRTDVVQLLLQDPVLKNDHQVILKCLQNTVQHGQTGLLEFLLADPAIKSGAEIRHLLKTAAAYRQIGVIRMLQPLAKGFDIQAASQHAMQTSDLFTCKALLSYPNGKLNSGILAVMFMDACQANDVDFIKNVLFESGVKLDRRWEAYACQQGRTEIVKALLDCPQWDTTLSQEELNIAAQNGNLELLKIFLTSPYLPPDLNLRTTLKEAIRSRHPDVVQFLLNLPSQRLDADDITVALANAVEINSIMMSRILLADTRCDPESLGDTPKTDYVRLISQATKDLPANDSSIKVLDSILASFEDDEEKVTTFTGHFIDDACAAGDLGIIRALSGRPSFGAMSAASCFSIACKNSHAHIAKFLVENMLEDPGSYIRSRNITGNLQPAKTFFYSGFLDKSNIAGIRYIFSEPSLVTLGDVELVRFFLETYKDALAPDMLQNWLSMAKDFGMYRMYKAILEFAPGLDNPNAPIHMFALYVDILHVEAGRISSLPKVIPVEDLDVLVYHAARFSEMAYHLLGLQVDYIKKHHIFRTDGMVCKYGLGSKKCQDYILDEMWPLIDSLMHHLKKLEPMRTDVLEAIIFSIINSLQSGMLYEQIGYVTDALGTDGQK